MHGTEHCKQEHRAFRFSVPRLLFFSSRRINTSKHAAMALLLGTGRSYRPFARLQQVALSRAPFQGQCSRPDPSLPCQLLPLPVRPSAPLPIPVRPKIGRFNASRPLQLPQPAWPAAGSSLHSPSGFLRPSGSKRSAESAACQPAFRVRPISVRSPPPSSITRFSAADHRSRSATFSEACCSSNLLEPHSLCSPERDSSTNFVSFFALFLSLFLP
jgi:hypothetical protein